MNTVLQNELKAAIRRHYPDYTKADVEGAYARREEILTQLAGMVVMDGVTPENVIATYEDQDQERWDMFRKKIVNVLNNTENLEAVAQTFAEMYLKEVWEPAQTTPTSG